MFTPRGYTAVPQDVVSQDEDEVFENNNLSRSFDEQRKNWDASRNTDAMTTPRASRESEEAETKERRVKRNVRFESRSLDDKPEPMSNARRLCFVVSLMICTLTIFVFAFTVPCKGPSCNVANMITTVTSNLEKFHQNWSTVFPGYSTGIVFHLSSTKTREVVVSYDGKRVSGNDLTKKHRNEKFGVKNKWNTKSRWNTKESGLISLNEDNGKLLWLYNASDVVKLIECRTDDNDFEMCLIQSSHGRLQLINPKRNQIIWSTRILIGSILPSIIIGISDCDGDDGRDILLSYDRFNTTCIPPTNKTFCTHPGIVQLISGRTGYPLGTRLNIPQNHLIKRVSVHSTRQAENLIFVLTVGNKGHVKVISIQDLYGKILESRGESPFLFINSTVSVSDIVSTDHAPVVKDLNKDFVEDIILVTLAGNKHSLTAVDGGKLKRMWRIAFGLRKMLSQPVVGHYNDDEVPDILVILDDPVLSLLNQSLVQILDGQNGNIIWSRKLRLAKNTTPLSANVGYKNDVFLLWIEKESKTKYEKIFPSKTVKDVEVQRKPAAQQALNKATSFDTRNAVQKNVSGHSIQQQPKHHRSPRSVDMARELDSLVDEIFVKDIENTAATNLYEKPRPESNVKLYLKPRRIESTHKILEDILKREGEPSSVIDKESSSHGGRQKATSSTRSPTQRPGFDDIHALHSKPSTRVRQNFRQMKIDSLNSANDGRKPSPTTLNLATQRPVLYDIRALHSKPSTRVKQSVRQMKINSHKSGNNERKPSPTTLNLATQRPVLYDTRALHSTPSTRVRQSVRQMKINSHNSGNNGRKPTPSTLNLATQRPVLYDIRALHSEPSKRVKNKQTVTQVLINNADNEHKAGRNPSPTVNLAVHISLGTERPINNNNPQARTKKPRESHLLNDDKVTSERHTAPTTKKPSTKLPHRKRVEQFIVNSPGSGIDDESDSNSATTMTRSRVNNGRQSPTSTLPTERSLNMQYKIYDITQKQSRTMADREATVANADNDGNDGRQSPTGTSPESHGNIQSEPTRKIVNSRKVEDVIIQTPFSGNTSRGSKNDAMQNPTITLPTTRPESQQRDIEIIKSKSTIRMVNSGIAEDVGIQNPGKVESRAGQGNFPTAKHISKEVTSPTTHARNQQDKKTISDRIDNDNIKSKEQSLISDINSVPGRVLAPRPGFSAHQTSAETSKTNSPVLDSSLVLTPSDHHTSVTAEGMADIESENTQDKIRAGKDIIVMPTKASINKQLTGQKFQKPTQQKRQINSNTQTATQQQQDANINSDKRLLNVNKPTYTSPNNSALSNDGNKPLNVGSAHRIKNTIIKTASSPSQDVQKHSQTISTPKPPTKLQQLNKTNHDKNAVNKLTDESNTLPTLGKSNLDTKVRLHDSVLSNAGDKKGNVGNATKNSHILHPIKLNGTRHLDGNKSVQVNKQKSNETLQRQPSQLLKTTQINQSKLGNIHHTTTRPHIPSSKKKHHVECHKGYDLALIAIFPDSPRNTFTVISQENSVRKKKGSSHAQSSCDTLWPTLNSSPLVHDSDSDGFLEIIYAVNYGEETRNERTMKVRKFSIKVDSED